MTPPTDLPEPVTASLTRWHAMVDARDLSGLEEICRPEARFLSPAVYRPYETATRLAHVVRTAMSIFENFTYTRESASPDGHTVLLEFTADVDERHLKGLDIVTFDESGLITEFEVVIRPLSGLQTLVQRMGERLDAAVLAP